jgi:penicillin-binding protein 1B
MSSPTFWKELHTDLAALPAGRRRLLIAATSALTLLVVGAGAFGISLWQICHRFPSAPYTQPSRLYGRATRLAPGAELPPADLLAELTAEGYRPRAQDRPLTPGTFHQQEGFVTVDLRRFETADGPAGGQMVEVAYQGERIARVRLAGRPVASAELEPPLLASFYGDKVNERRPVRVSKLPPQVVRAVLAAEDSGFFNHPGISVPGIARALWADVRGGAQQGGSTITQQLVKNVYLSSERTLARKAKEAVLAMVLEMRYRKVTILEAYLNSIYWGRSGSANLIGLGAASRAYFGKDASELTLAEAATLAGMICAPGEYSPLEHPDSSRGRRDRVLRRMAALGWVSAGTARQAEAEPLATSPQTVEARPLAPYFADAAAAEAAARFHVDDLADSGYLLFSTLGWREQRQAEAAVAAGLTGAEARWERSRQADDEPLQASLLSVDPRDGAILAYVGGRDYAESQFDRVAQAHRQVGSAFKPVVYAAAFAEGVATPASLLRDLPVEVRFGKTSWSPQNYDRSFRGNVTVRTALEQSLNVPTVRLAFQVGLSRIAALGHELGFAGDLAPVPALALGAVEATPRELATVYSTLAGGGTRPEIYGLAAVHDRFGEAVPGDERRAAPRVLSREAAYLVTAILQGVLDRGTGQAARSLGVHDRLAGKTGTTNDRRDSWFAGYSPDRVTVVWVGYDDNSRSHLSGNRAALPIWSHFTAGVRPAGGYPAFAQPGRIVAAEIDPATGGLATPGCPSVAREVFAAGETPAECPLHGSRGRYMTANLQGGPVADDGENPGLDEGAGRVVIENGEEPAEDDAAPDPAQPSRIQITPHRPPPLVAPWNLAPEPPPDPAAPPPPR